MAMANQQNIFSERLKRIDSGEGNTMGRIHCGIEEIPAKKKSGVVAKSSRAGLSLVFKLIWIPSSMAIAILIGVVATVLARFGLFQAMSVSAIELSAESGLIADGASALILAFIVCFLLRIRQSYHMVAAAVGACLMIGGMHQLVHDSPDLWSKAFSPEWVQKVMDTTKPDTFEFRSLTVAAAF